MAALCRVTDSAVSHWRQQGIPEARRMFLELARPELFKAAKKKAKAAA